MQESYIFAHTAVHQKHSKTMLQLYTYFKNIAITHRVKCNL